MQSHSPGKQDTSSIALTTGTLLVRTNGLLRLFSQKMWQERLVTLTTQELYVFKASVLSIINVTVAGGSTDLLLLFQEGAESNSSPKSLKGERYVFGPRPKLLVGAGDAPGHGFQLVYFDVKKGREKTLSLGATSQETLDAWIAAFIAGVPGCSLEHTDNALDIRLATPAGDRKTFDESLPPPPERATNHWQASSPSSVQCTFGLSLTKESRGPPHTGALITVSGIVPGSPSDRCAQIMVGDILTDVGNDAVDVGLGAQGAEAQIKRAAAQVAAAAAVHPHVTLCFISHISNDPYLVTLRVDKLNNRPPSLAEHHTTREGTHVSPPSRPPPSPTLPTHAAASAVATSPHVCIHTYIYMYICVC